MNETKFDNKYMLLLPAIITFFLACLLIYKYSFPISWDVYYHIHMIDLYLRNGLVFWDYETVAPMGRLIMYPPLFHLILAGLSKFLNIAPLQLCTLLQPFFGFYLIGIITYVAYKLNDIKTGVITGFLGMLCFVTFNRSVICTPATIAIGLSMLSCLFFFEAFKNNNNLKKFLISAICLSLIFNLHMATAIITFGVLGLYSLILLLKRELSIKILLIYLIIFIVFASPWWLYVQFKYGLFFNSKETTNISLINFLWKYYGIIPSLLTLVGYYSLYKQRFVQKSNSLFLNEWYPQEKYSKKVLFLMVWSLSILILSQVYLIGVNTVSIRILEVASYPLIIVAGIGFTYIMEKIANHKKIVQAILIVLIIFSSLSALMYIDSYTPDVMVPNETSTKIIPENIHLIIDPVGTIYKPSIISSRFSLMTLAHSRYEIMQWFINNNKTGIVVSEDSILDTIIVSTSRKPVIYGGFTESIPEYVVDPLHIVENHATRNELDELNIDYIILGYKTPIPSYAKEVYKNTHYIICERI